MKWKVTTKINERQTVEAEVEGKMDMCLRGTNALLAYDGKCGLCASTEVMLQTKVAKGFSFIEYVCLNCNARAQWGSYKDGGYFLKNWEKYTSQGEAPQQAPKATPEVNLDEQGEIPF